MARTLISVPKSVARGAVVPIRATVQHTMETGYRLDAMGKRVPRDIVTRFTCHLDDVLVLAADVYPAVAANPYFAFSLIAAKPGTLVFRWVGDNGFEQTERVPLVVV